MVHSLSALSELTAIDWFTVSSGLPQLGIASEQTRPLRPSDALAEELLSVRRSRRQRSTVAASESN